jgi:hypothetical protein
MSAPRAVLFYFARGMSIGFPASFTPLATVPARRLLRVDDLET